MSDALYILSGLLLGLAFQGGLWFFAIPFAVISAVLGWLNRPRLPSSPVSGSVPVLRATRDNDSTAVGRILRSMPQTAAHSDLRVAFENEKTEFNEPTSKLKVEQIWSTVESELDTSLRYALQALKTLIPKTNTVAVFFPGNKRGTLVLRQFVSDSEAVVPHALIQENCGLVSQLTRSDIIRILEGDIQGGKGLYYYSGNPTIRSVAGVPILDRHRSRQGVLFMDSASPNAFDSAEITALNCIANSIYTMSFKSYASAKNYIEQQQFSILYHYQKNFFQNMAVKDIYGQIFEYVRGNIPYDRMMILAVENQKEGKGSVVWCDGVDRDLMIGQEFSLNDKGLVILSLMRNFPVERNFSGNPGEYVPRINEKEKRNNDLRYLFAMPIATESGAESAEIAICLESCQQNRYSDHEKELLKAIAGVAGFAYARARQFEAGKDLATKDGLTGLMNHRTLHERLRTEKLRAERQKINVGLLMLDIDHFKHINDTYGHPAGDEVIKGIASRIRDEVRGEIDVVARYGGEEFVVGLVDCSPEALKETAERIRKAIGDKLFDIHRAEQIPVTVSIGSFLVRPEYRDMKQALSFADKALYKAKNGGRNQVVEYIEYSGSESTKPETPSV
ncbi:MAG: GGDEF domain-containing protein [Fibrobacteraceae bacterium]